MKIGLAQIDTRVGDLAGNRARIVSAAEAADRSGADVIVFPELAVPGYPPRDLLYDEGFVDATIDSTNELALELASLPPTIVGTVARSAVRPPRHPGLFNVAAVLVAGRVASRTAKQLLPIYDVFHEPRWFVPGGASSPTKLAGARIGLLVCEDLWDEGYPVSPSAVQATAGAEMLVCISASPFRVGIRDSRLELAGRVGLPLVFVNLVGANDELIFDGGSFVADARGGIVSLLPQFDECVRVVDLDVDRGASSPIPEQPSEPEQLLGALTLGVRDFVYKNGLRRAFVGLSGGVDSALVACIARDALGADRVTGVAIPSRYTDPRSTESARELASNLGIAFEVVDLETLHTAAEASLGPLVAGDFAATTAENVQSRLRALVLMAFVNCRGGVLLNTSNKTELSVGYGTLYGDMAGALAVIGDLTKPQVYAVARHYDAGRHVIPPFILERPPSAELRPEQVDPFDYDREAPVIEALIRGDGPTPGTADADAERYRSRIRASEHKRWQAGIVLKTSDVAFGTGRMMPVTRV